MRQVLMNSNGALLARMPRPTLDAGSVLVRVHYSLISVGTELASLRGNASASTTANGETAQPLSRARYYLGRAIRDPQKALRRLARIGKSSIKSLFPKPQPSFVPKVYPGELTWNKSCARELQVSGSTIHVVTDDSPAAYQATSARIPVPSEHLLVLDLNGKVEAGPIAIGVLDGTQSTWLVYRTWDNGSILDQIIVDPKGSSDITLVIANAGICRSVQVQLDEVKVAFVPAHSNGLPATELDDQGWNVGYSISGEVVAVGENIADLAPGDWVACGGAGQANHADYVCIKRNLVCKIPKNCSLPLAATTTVGAIALQGVRRAAPQLGEHICVLGLGLIGQMTVQMLCAAGCNVIGLDLDAKRVCKALKLGMAHGASDPDAVKALVRDVTAAQGVDRTIITAATKSNAVINLAMELTRRKGTVVIVGDIGLQVERVNFYKKEIDLLMSTSYGPGRYDAAYEEEGHDYPYSYVRWTLNRNMQAYMELIAAGKIRISELIDEIVPIDSAPETYRKLAQPESDVPLGVLFHYPADPRPLPENEQSDSPCITIRGHRRQVKGVIQYALVGLGAFGTSMLVPAMDKRKDRFFLRGVVSRDTVRAGNYCREHRIQVHATDLKHILSDPAFDLVVIATRHDQHAEQTISSLKAGKHVFVEKPLALSWDELDRIVETYDQLHAPPVLMVGFNRRFSPAVQRLKQHISGRRSPLMINYRLNGGYIPLDSWIQGAQGGGRNLGEACHMYDVFRFLTGSPVQHIVASSIRPGQLPYRQNDNFAATLTYDDGSVANLVYTALGPKEGFGKERIEVFCDGEVFLIDDFRSLTRGSSGEVLWQRDTPDKGHLTELSMLGDAIATGANSPIPFAEIIETTAVALHIEDLIHGRIVQDDAHNSAA